MPVSTRIRHVDPVAATAQFKADLAAMQVGPKATADQPAGAVKQRLLAKSFGVAGFKFNRWQAELSEAQTLEDALQPSFWAAQADQVMGQDKTSPKGRLDIIELRKADAGLYAELLITEIGKGFMKVQLVREAQPPAVDLPDGALTTKWNAGAKTHDVVRKADGVVMKPGFQSKASAAAWIADHLRKMAA